MANFIDIAPLSETVTVRGQQVTVRGIELEHIAKLLFRFPDLREMMAKQTWDVERIGALAKPLQCALIAAGVDEIDEAGAANLALGEKVELLEKLVRITMPGGPVPFMRALTGLMGVVGAGEASPKGRGTRSA